MKLASATQGQVVRNARNGSHYRFERLEKSRVRIRPLELFPNGLLMAKPTDTLVDPDIEVHLIGDWTPNMRVEGKPTHSRPTYERELARCEVELDQLRIDYEALPPGGKGRESRGSWANKIKNVEARIVMLRRGLEEGNDDQMVRVVLEATAPSFVLRQVVQLPSGLPAVVTGVEGPMVSFAMRFQDMTIRSSLPGEILRPWSAARTASV